jgi:hypothetical protein
MAHIAHQPAPVYVEGVVRRWLAGVVVLGGVELHRHSRLVAWGASSIRVAKDARGAQAFRRCAGRPDRDG